MQQKTPLIRIRNLRRSYQMGNSTIDALSGIDIDIYPNEYVAIMGPSGSGKTTCLMMLAGFETATHGEIRLGGREINNIPPHKRGIGMVFQNYALFPHMTVAENVNFGLEARRIAGAEAKARVTEALAQVRLSEFANRYPEQLSGGQRQRVAIARALVTNPSIVLADEPTGNLDSATGEEIMRLFDKLHGEGNTLIVVTHEQHIADHANRVVRLSDGDIVSDTRKRPH